MRKNRTANTNPKELLTTKILDQVRQGYTNLPSFHFGQVIMSSDPQNANRLKVRIPLIDDVFYYDTNGVLQDRIGDDDLPWCISSNNRFINTPENGSIVLVGFFLTDTPYNGRFWISAVEELDNVRLFDTDKLVEETTTGAWQNAEDNIEIEFNNTPELRGRKAFISKTKTTHYQVGIRGKDNNKLLLDKGITTLSQQDTSLILTEDADLSAKEINILSSQDSVKQKPVFADPLFSFLDSTLSLMNQILLLLAVPGEIILPVSGSPVGPNPSLSSVVASLQQLKLQLQDLKQDGASKHIKIN